MPDSRTEGEALAGKRHSTLIEDASVQAALQPWVEMECYQLGRGSRVSRLDNLDLDSQQVMRESQIVGVQKLGLTPPNLCIVSCCTPDPAFRFTELYAGGVDTIFFMPGDVEFDIFVPAGAQTHYVSFCQDEFLRGARALDPARWERVPGQLLTCNGMPQAELQAAVNRWLKVSQTFAARGVALDADLMRRVLLQHILMLVSATGQHDCRPSSLERLRAFQLCKMARAFVEDSLADNIVPTSIELCARLGVSERTLQYAFRAYIDMTPLAYLRFCRLNRVRAVLRGTDPQTTTVTEVATRFGFLHLSRFAQDYRRLFGELPSQTFEPLKRTAGRVAA